MVLKTHHRKVKSVHKMFTQQKHTYTRLINGRGRVNGLITLSRQWLLTSRSQLLLRRTTQAHPPSDIYMVVYYDIVGTECQIRTKDAPSPIVPKTVDLIGLGDASICGL